MSDNPQISIVVPLFNEGEVFDTLVDRLVKVLNSTDLLIEVVFVNDGSSDNTIKKITNLVNIDKRFWCVDLSRNFGHQIAFSAGMSVCNATECVMLMDGDLQDPPEMIFDFYAKYTEGFDVVYAIRKNRKEKGFKKLAYYFFYRLQKKVSNIEIPMDSGDFSLISRPVIDIINKMPEESRYLRGLRSWVGFKQVGIEYDRDERLDGKPKYTFAKLIQLAFNGIFNFSEFPIRFILRLGILTFVGALIYFGTVVYRKFVLGVVPDGFTALLFVIILIGALQFIAIGLLGEYILRIFFQTKKRPLFIIKKIIKNY